MRSTTLVYTLLLVGCSVDRFSSFTFSDDGGAADLAGDLQGADLSQSSADLAIGPCGERGAACCTTGPECQGGGCCDRSGPDPRCVPAGAPQPNNSGTICAGGVFEVCGSNADPCCPGGVCFTGCCVGGICGANGTPCQSGYTCDATSGDCTAAFPSTCGGSGEACCTGSNPSTNPQAFCVASGLACNPSSGTCETCGSKGDLCCEGNLCDSGGCCDHSGGSPTCVADGDQCAAGIGRCNNGGCGVACGRPQQFCCGMAVGCSAAFTTCETGTCVTCGGPGQKCCKDGAAPWCTSGFVCSAGSCIACGASGQQCCDGDRCDLTSGLSCLGGYCSL
jgi:hypothetical protein